MKKISIVPALGMILFLCCTLATQAGGLKKTEERRIEAMLFALGQQKGLVFIRNGVEYSAEEAVAHLRLKLRHMRNRISTAEQFVEKAGTASFASGKPYFIRRSGVPPEPAGPFFHQLLRDISSPLAPEKISLKHP